MSHTVGHSKFYKRIDYGNNPHAGATRNNAQARGWGSGWPNCQTSKLMKVAKAGVTVLVRREIAQLIATLFETTEALGYDICHLGANPPRDSCCGTWGFACRAIRGTRVPSNHSWGLAVDVNAPCNPMQSTFRSNIPPSVVEAWEGSGFYWGGRYLNRPDGMHFEYLGRPADVAGHLAAAQRYLQAAQGGPSPTPKPKPKPKPAPLRWRAYARTPSGSRTARVWDRGDDVKSLQVRFGLKVDGYFGADTETAVRWYQRVGRLTVDGIVGPATWRLLNGHHNTVDAGTVKNAFVHRQAGTGIAEIQRRLHTRKIDPGPVDGIPGPRTRAGYAAYQRKLGYRGTDANGIPGIRSLQALGFRVVD